MSPRFPLREPGDPGAAATSIRRIKVVPYDPLWPSRFEEEASRISAVLGGELVAIHHIGSTAIVGMWAKPIIDIMPLVRDIQKVDMYSEAMIALGYEPKGENTIPGRRFFIKGGDANRSHHVHAYEPDNPEVARHLDFRDYLVGHPQDAEAYASLKRSLAARFPHDINGYIAGKDAFVKEILQRAQAWRESGRLKDPAF